MSGSFSQEGSAFNSSKDGIRCSPSGRPVRSFSYVQLLQDGSLCCDLLLKGHSQSPIFFQVGQSLLSSGVAGVVQQEKVGASWLSCVDVPWRQSGTPSIVGFVLIYNLKTSAVWFLQGPDLWSLLIHHSLSGFLWSSTVLFFFFGHSRSLHILRGYL